MANLAIQSLTHAPSGGAPVMGGGPHPNPPKAAPKTSAGKAAAQRAGTYNPLVPLTQQQIKTQATNTISSAYKPIYTQLNSQQQQIQNVYDKQNQDNRYFQHWLDSKTAALQAEQANVDQTTNSLAQQISASMGGQATVNQPAGGALAQNLAATNSANSQIAGAAATASLGMERNAEAQQNASALNTENFLQAGAQKEATNFQNAQTKLQTTRSTELDKQAADTQKEIARLQGVNINLAENNRNYQTAAQKLGITAANTQSEINTRAANTKIAAANAQTNAGRLAETQKQNSFDNWIKTQNLSLAQQRFTLSQLNTNSEIAARNAKTQAAANGGQLTLSEQNTIYGAIDKTRGEIQSLINQGLTPQAAYQAMQNGYYLGTEPYQSTTTKNGKTTNTTGKRSVKITVPRVSNTGYLNAAYNLATQGQITEGDARYINTIFGTTQNRYTVSQPNQGLGPH